MIKHLPLGEKSIWIAMMIRNEIEMCHTTEMAQKACTYGLSRQLEVAMKKRKRALDQIQIASIFTLDPTLPEETTQLSP